MELLQLKIENCNLKLEVLNTRAQLNQFVAREIGMERDRLMEELKKATAEAVAAAAVDQKVEVAE